VEHQKNESTGTKTHEEIAELLKTIKVMEEKIKNPDLNVEELFEPEVPFQEEKPLVQQPLEQISEKEKPESQEEVPIQKKEKRKKKIKQKPARKKSPEEQSQKRSLFWRKEKIGELDTDTSLENLPPQKSTAPMHTTFTLQLDAEGNLIGFPLKKTIPEGKKGWSFFKKKGGSSSSEEEPVPGIKGKVLRVISRLKPKGSSEGESGNGIGGKIKGLLRRRSKD